MAKEASAEKRSPQKRKVDKEEIDEEDSRRSDDTAMYGSRQGNEGGEISTSSAIKAK